MSLPRHTRLRWVSSPNKEKLVKYLEALPYRVQIYQIAWSDKEWVMWFVPDDKVQLEFKYGKLKE